MFLLNEEVVYPAYGVAQISREIKKDIDGKIVEFFELKFITKEITILVPKEGMVSVGVRKISNKDIIEEALKVVASQVSEDFLENTIVVSWNRRNKEYQNYIRQGNIFDLARIYRDLKYLEQAKGLSFAEKNIILQVEGLLSEECMIVLKINKEESINVLKSLIINQSIKKRGACVQNSQKFDNINK